MSSTLTSADFVQSRSSTRVHAPPGGKTTISFGDDVPQAPARTPVAAPLPPNLSIDDHEIDASQLKTPKRSSNGLCFGIAIADGSPLRSATLAAISDSGASLCSFEVSDFLSLPFAVSSLMAKSVHCVIVVGQMLETESWCSREIVQTVHSSLISLSLQKSIPVVFGLNHERIPMAQLNATAGNIVKSALQLCASGGKSDGPSSVQHSARSPNSFRSMVQNQRSYESEQQTMDVEPILESLRDALKKQGASGMCGLSRKFRIADADNSGSLDKSEVMKIFSTLKLNISSSDLDKVISCFDRDGDGLVSYNEFLSGVRGKMNERRMKLVLAAFGLMDKNKDGILDARDLRSRYDVSRHPDVLSGKKSKDEALQDFLNTFDVQNRDGKVTPSEWCEYYSDVSASIDLDDYFELMMRNAWRMSGGEGFAANTANRRVLVTHADGKQTVEEIKDDLGIKADDNAALIANLKKQGINPAKLEMFGGMKSASKGGKAQNSPAAPLASPSKRQAPGGKSNLVLG